jgi:hypothetical protein
MYLISRRDLIGLGMSMGRPLRAPELIAQEWEQVAGLLPLPAVFLMLLWLAHRTATEQLLARRQLTLMDTPSAVRRCSCWKRNSRAEHVASAWGRSRLTTRRIVRTVREMNVTPQIIRNGRNRSSNLYHRTTRQPGKRAFAIGERVRSYFDGLATK